MDRKESLKQGELCILGLTEILQEQEARSLGNWNIGVIKTVRVWGAWKVARKHHQLLCLSSKMAERVRSGSGTDRLWISEEARADSFLWKADRNLMGGISGWQAVRLQADAIDLPVQHFMGQS